MAVPVAAGATCNFVDRSVASEEADLDFSDEGDVFSVAIRSSLSPERRAYWTRLGIYDSHDPQLDVPEPVLVWQIAKARFGPEPRFRLRTETRNGLKRYTVTVENLRYGRIADRRTVLVFQQRLVPDPEGQDLLDRIRDGEVPCDHRIRAALKDLPQTVPGLRVFTIEVHTNLWSLSRNPTATETFALEPETGEPGTIVEQQLRLRHWINAKHPKLFQLVHAGRITSTLRLIFNGQIGFERQHTQRLARLSLDSALQWQVETRTVRLWTMTPEIVLDQMAMGWEPARPKKAEVPDPAEPRAPGTGENGEKPVQPAVLPDGIEDAALPFELRGRAVVNEAVATVTLDGEKTDPGLRLTLARGQSPEVLFRVLDATEVRDGSLSADQMRSEASLMANWTDLHLTGAEDAAAGPFKALRGRLLERVEAPAAMDRFDYARCRGNIGFGGAFTGTASRHWRVTTPIGPIGFRGLAPEDDAQLAQAEAPDAPFRDRTGEPVQIVYRWDGWSREDPVRCNTPRAQWAEINGVLREAAVHLPGATSARLTFAPTHLTILFARKDLPPPLTSYIRLSAAQGEERAQLDLGEAALRAARTEDLLSLTFRFRDFGLSFRGSAVDLVRKNAACLIRAETGAGNRTEVHDTRPVMVVEFPGQHLLEEAFFLPNLPDPPDVALKPTGAGEAHVALIVDASGIKAATEGSKTKVRLTRLDNGGWRLDPNDRVQVTELLRQVKDTRFRCNLRSAIQGEKITASTDEVFWDFAEAYRKKVQSRRPAGLPGDQDEYIGPYALDPDAMRLAMQVWRKMRDDNVAKQAADLLAAVAAKAAEIQAQPKASAESPEMLRIRTAPDSFDGALALEGLLETQFPSYQLYRSAYRDAMIDALQQAEEGALGRLDISALHLEAIHTLRPPDLDNPGKIDKDAKLPAWAAATGVSKLQFAARHGAAFRRFKTALKGQDEITAPARARLSPPSRLAFRVQCADGITSARTRVDELDTPADADARLVRERLHFDLASLTRFSDFELSVIRRAETVYSPSETGRLDGLSRRRLNPSQAARLDHLNFTSGDFVTAETRLSQVADSLRAPPGRYETAIEMARLTLSPDQNAAVVATNAPVAPGVFDAEPSGESLPAIRLFAARFLVDEVDPNLRAVHSPDLRPDVFEARLRNRTSGGRFPGGGAPPRGPIAPWHLGPHQTQTIALGEGDLDAIAGNRLLQRLARYLRGRKTFRAATTPRDLKFRAPLDAYARHEIVLLSSAWGLPVLGKRSESGQIVDGASQAEAEPRHLLINVAPGSALYVPRTLGVAELALTTLGMTLRHASSFEPPAAAFDNTGLALFEAMSLESWQQWTNLGRDVHCEVVYKGFLWPIGQRASLVQVTERDYLIDQTGAIRAVLRQRLYIRVGKAEKLFPALKQPALGRRFPVERLVNLTAQTPDIVDPSENAPPSGAAPGTVTPNGRVLLGMGARGLVFWPRTASLESANIRFELDLDGTKTDLPLIFVDNVAANDAATLEALAIYYNRRLPTPDPVAAAEGQVAFEPLVHIRTLDMQGGKRRYAAETQAGSASVETLLWTLCATGLETRGPVAQGTLVQRHDVDYRSDPLLQGADQPPFYPAVDCARILPRQAERLVGGPLTPQHPRAVLDGRYVADGLPAAVITPNGETRAVAENEAEVYLSLIDQPHLGMGQKGDNSGGVFRPSGRLVALSRSRGALSWSTVQDPPQPDGLPDGVLPGASTNDEPRRRELLLGGCNRLYSLSALFSIGEKVPPATNGSTPGQQDPETADICITAQQVKIDTGVVAGLDKARKLYTDIFDGEAKILGLVRIKDLFAFIQSLDPPATGAPKLAEQVQYGAAGAQKALADVQGGVDDVLGAVNDAADKARREVILPLSGAVKEIRLGWDALDRDIGRLTGKLPGDALKSLSFSDIFPELHCTLVAFDTALSRAAAAADALSFALATSEVFSAGRRFLDALFRAAADPGRRIAAAISAGIDDILGLFSDLEKSRDEILKQLLKAYSGLGDGEIEQIVRIADWLAGKGNRPNEDVLRRYAELLARGLVPEGSAPFDLVSVPGLPPEIRRKLALTPDQLHEVVTTLIFALLQAIIGNRPPPKLDTLLFEALQTRNIGQRLLDFVLLDFRALDGRDGMPLAIAIVRTVRARIPEAKAGATGTALEILDTLDRRLGEIEQAWDDVENQVQGAQAAFDRLKPIIVSWVKAGFEEDWRLVKGSEHHLRTAIVAARNSDLGTAIQSVRALIELHFGPLTIPVPATLCTTLVEPVLALVGAIKPQDASLAALETAFAGQVTVLETWTADFGKTKADIEQQVQKLLANADVTNALKKIGLLNEVQQTANALTSTAALLSDTLDLVLTEAKGLKADLAIDQLQVQALVTTLDKLPKTTEACEAAPFTQLKDVGRALRDLIEHRRMMTLRLAARVERVANAIRALTTAPGTSDALIAVAAAGALDAALEEALAKLPAGTDQAIKTAVTGLRERARAMQEDLEAAADGYAAQLSQLLKSVADAVGTELEQIRDAIDPQTSATAAALNTHLADSLDAVLRELDRNIAWLRQVGSVLDKTKTLKALRDAQLPDPAKSTGRPILDVFRSEAEDLTIAVGLELARNVIEDLSAVEESFANLVREGRQQVADIVNDTVRKVLTGVKIDGKSLPDLYAAIAAARDKQYTQASDLGGAVFARPLLLMPVGRPKLGSYTPATTLDKLEPATDQLAGDVAWLTHLSANDVVGPNANRGARPFIDAFLNEWSRLQPTPILVAIQIADIVRDIVKGDIFAAIDFQDLRRQVESYVLSLVPTKTEMTFGYGVELGDKVRDATAGIFAPGPGTKLTIKTGITIDLSPGGPNIHSVTRGALGAFDVKLVGDAFDALTLKFAGASFVAETGKKMEFDIAYSDYEIGPMLEFVQQFQSFMTPKGNSGFFLTPVTSPSFGIEAGYILNLGDFSVGTMAISNVGLATSAILPFENAAARFKASLSTRLSPFTITYAPYGGSGFFAIEANANGIIGFEASFEFGGSAVFAFGPLTGQGRLMAGFYIRMSTADNGQKLTELSATFFVGGSASIWIFSFAASLSVRLGMVNGNMSGEAIFSFSFSMGFADFEYSITVFKQEAKGFNGQDTASLGDGPFGPRRLRVADFMGMRDDTIDALDRSQPRIDRDTVCQGRDWKTYSSYFSNVEPEDPFG